MLTLSQFATAFDELVMQFLHSKDSANADPANAPAMIVKFEIFVGLRESNGPSKAHDCEICICRSWLEGYDGSVKGKRVIGLQGFFKFTEESNLSGKGKNAKWTDWQAASHAWVHLLENTIEEGGIFENHSASSGPFGRALSDMYWEVTQSASAEGHSPSYTESFRNQNHAHMMGNGHGLFFGKAALAFEVIKGGKYEWKRPTGVRIEMFKPGLQHLASLLEKHCA